MEKNKIEHTAAQKRAINATGSILVSASAGTGKTSVLTERVKRLVVDDGETLSSNLILTFSRAAAAEMAERLFERLAAEANNKDLPVAQRNRLKSELKDFGFNNIQTIHSFCSDVIRDKYYEVGLSPDFSVANEIDTLTLKRKTLSKVMDKWYSMHPEDLIVISEMKSKIETVDEIILGVYEKLMSIPDGLDWFEEEISTYLGDSRKYIVGTMEEELNEAIRLNRASREALEDSGHIDSRDLIEKVEDDLNALLAAQRLLAVGTIEAIDSIDLSPLKRVIRFKEELEEARDLRNLSRAVLIDKYVDNEISITEDTKRMNAMYHPLNTINKIVKEFDREYSEEKRRANVIDYNDMEKFAYEILKNEQISEEYRDKFKNVFIDEYQDTNVIQERIISRIVKDDNLFCVGDLKQSIYRFRSSDPLLFSKRSHDYRINGVGEVIELNQNFRSSQNILNAANDVFYAITDYSKEIDYGTGEELVYSRNMNNNEDPVLVYNIDMQEFKGIGITSKEVEIYNIVDLIRENMEKSIFDPKLKENRPVEYRDINILVRKLTGTSDLFAQIFTKSGIPYVIERAGQLYETAEVEILLNFLKLIEDFTDDIALISIMHFGFFGFTDDDLIDLRLHSYKGTLCENLLEVSSEHSGLGLRAMKLVAFINKYKEKLNSNSLSDVIRKITTELNYLDYWMGQRGGKQKVENIRLLLHRVEEYEAKYTDGLTGFLKLAETILNSSTVVSESIGNSGSNAVTISTIHRSKGLEYPLVIIPFLGSRFSTRDQSAGVIIDKDAGVGVEYIDAENFVEEKIVKREAIEKFVRDKSREEEMRLLYVAMTRAKERLILQGVSSKHNSFALSSTNNAMSWIVETLLKENASSLTADWQTRYANFNSIVDIAKEGGSMKVRSLLETLPREASLLDVSESEKEGRQIPQSIAASSIKDMEEYSVDNLDRFDTSGADRGNAYHKFMKNFSIENIKNGSNAKKELERLNEMGFFTDKEYSLIKPNHIDNFFNTLAGQMLINSSRSFRETSVSTLRPSESLGYDPGKEILIKSNIDIVYEYDGKWYIVDYKTDFIDLYNRNASLQERVKVHKPQLQMYKEAFEGTFGQKVEETYLAFLEAGIVEKI